MQRKRPGFWSALYFSLALVFGFYLLFSAIGGPFGLFKYVQIEAEATTLRQERDALAAELAELENLTHRLSDEYLDLDLLDEQTREILGYARADEVVIH